MIFSNIAYLFHRLDNFCSSWGGRVDFVFYCLPILYFNNLKVVTNSQSASLNPSLLTTFSWCYRYHFPATYHHLSQVLSASSQNIVSPIIPCTQSTQFSLKALDHVERLLKENVYCTESQNTICIYSLFFFFIYSWRAPFAKCVESYLKVKYVNKNILAALT